MGAQFTSDNIMAKVIQVIELLHLNLNRSRGTAGKYVFHAITDRDFWVFFRIRTVVILTTDASNIVDSVLSNLTVVITLGMTF